MADRPRKILIVGGSTGGLAAAGRLRQLSDFFEIILIDRSFQLDSFDREFSNSIGGCQKQKDADPLRQNRENAENRFRTTILPGHEAIRIDRVAKQLIVRNLKDDTKSNLSYDRLILCTGSSSILPHIEGIHCDLVKTARTPADIDALLQRLEKQVSNRLPVVVMGGTPIGLALTETLRNRGFDLVLIEAAKQVLIGSDYEMLTPLHRELEKQGVPLRLDISISKLFQKSDDEIVLKLSDSTTISARFIVIAAGIRPEVSLALDAGLELGITGGIRVNDRMQTFDPDIYAIGDAAEIPVSCGGKKIPIRLSQVESVCRQAKIATDHLYGFRHHPFRSSGGTVFCRFFETTFAQTGFSEKQLHRERIPYEKVYVRTSDRQSKEILTENSSPETLRFKILFSPEDGKLYGAEAVGKNEAVQKIEPLATVLHFGGTVRQLCDLELGFSPSAMPADDPIRLAGNIACDLMDGLLCNTARKEIKRMKPEQILLDLRSGDDFNKETIPGAVSFPLENIETKIVDLNKEKEYLLCGYDGLDGYVACRFLIRQGFKAKNFPGGFLVYKDSTDEHKVSKNND